MADEPTNPVAAEPAQAPNVNEPSVPQTTGPLEPESTVPVSATQPVGEPPATTPVEPSGEPAPPDDARVQAEKLRRLEQQMAEQRRFFTGLGIDPDSDIVRRYNAGIVSKKELLEHAGVILPDVPEPQAPAVESPRQRLDSMIAKLEKDGGSVDDVVAGFKLIKESLDAEDQRRQTDSIDNKVGVCMNVAASVVRADELHSTLPPELQEIEEQMFLASTDNLALQAARGSGDTESYLNPRAYQYFAEQNGGRLNQLRNHWIEYGRKLGQNSLLPAPAGTQVTPVSAGAGPAPSTPPTTKVTQHNWKEEARRRAPQYTPGGTVL